MARQLSKNEKPFISVYCVKGKQNWTYWKLKDNKCPCCNEPVGIIWYAPPKKREDK